MIGINRKTKNVLLGTAGAMMSAAAIREGINRSIDRNMVGEALDRKEPKVMQRLKNRMKGCAENAEEMAQLQQIGAWLESRPHSVVQIESYDGITLKGHLFEVDKPKRAIIAMHGWRSGWANDFGAVADFLRDNGCSVLYAEQRGQGGSGGEYMGFGMIERFDCLEWVKWLNSLGFDKGPIYLVGISMGATTVLMTAGFPELPGNVAGIIADCGFTSARAVWKHISEKNLHLPYDRRRKHVDSLCRKRIEMDSDAYSTLDAMAVCKTPVLFVHGSADTFVPPEMTVENFEACRAPKRLLLVEGANHGMSYFMDKERYEAEVKEFWREQESVR